MGYMSVGDHVVGTRPRSAGAARPPGGAGADDSPAAQARGTREARMVELDVSPDDLDVSLQDLDASGADLAQSLQGLDASRPDLGVSPATFDRNLDVVHGPLRRRFDRIVAEGRWPLICYGGTRIALMLLAIVAAQVFSFVHHGTNTLSHELANWDGRWYINVDVRGYPRFQAPGQSTLGFLPLFPIVNWIVSHLLDSSYLVAGVIVSGVGGLVSTVLVQRLATQWWGPQTARKAVLLFCLFPGSVVFSMNYSEGLLIPLVAGCMLALSHKRWALAGVLAAFGTAVGADALCLIPMCAAASFVEIRRHGWRDPAARDSLIAPVLAPVGAALFAAFLWAWAGSPMASYIAQRTGWHEQTSPFAIPHQVDLLAHEIGFHFAVWHVNLNVVVGLLGTVFLVFALRYLWRERTALPLEVLVFTGCMTFLMVTSWSVPPNPRMLITAFPLVIVFAKYLHGQAWRRCLWITGCAFVVMSVLTFTGSLLRP